MSMKRLYHDHVLETSKVPKDAKTLEEIAERDLECSVEKARDIVNKLVKANKVERIIGKRISEAGAVISVTFYREVPQGPPAGTPVSKPVSRKR
jgi:hypothetical protein